jgi:hypothetical protein
MSLADKLKTIRPWIWSMVFRTALIGILVYWMFWERR